MPDKKLTEELLNELLDAPNIDGYIKEHDFAAPSLSDYLKQLLQEKGLERSRVVRMADLNETCLLYTSGIEDGLELIPVAKDGLAATAAVDMCVAPGNLHAGLLAQMCIRDRPHSSRHVWRLPPHHGDGSAGRS